jgi:hypothetical protein
VVGFVVAGFVVGVVGVVVAGFVVAVVGFVVAAPGFAVVLGAVDVVCGCVVVGAVVGLGVVGLLLLPQPTTNAIDTTITAANDSQRIGRTANASPLQGRCPGWQRLACCNHSQS